MTNNPHIEAIARAICCASDACGNADAQYARCQAHTFRDDAAAALREVLAQMREPSDAMLIARHSNSDPIKGWQQMLDQFAKECGL